MRSSCLGAVLLLNRCCLHSTLQVSDETELEALCAEISSQHHSGESPDSPSRPCCTFTYITMTGEEVELCQGGRNITVRYRKRSQLISYRCLIYIPFLQTSIY